MKVVLFHQHCGPEVLEYTDFPRPEPKPGEALIRLHAAALNRMDVMVRNGPCKFTAAWDTARNFLLSGISVTRRSRKFMKGRVRSKELSFHEVNLD